MDLTLLESKYIFLKQISLKNPLIIVKRATTDFFRLFLKEIIYFQSYPLFGCADSDINLNQFFLENVSSPLINFDNSLSLKINSSIIINSCLVKPLIIYEYLFRIQFIVQYSIFINIKNLQGHGSVRSFCLK